MSISIAPATAPISDVLERIAGRAAERDREPIPRFPYDAIEDLRAAGALAWNAKSGPSRPPAAQELALVRAVARADASVGRIFDGHLNGVERLAVQAPEDLREEELAAVREGRLVVGVWGGQPRDHEGQPATVERQGRGGEVLSGVKTFCSGAGGLDRALVLARDPHVSQPIAVWVDLSATGTVVVDERWYRGAGLRASVSHRVEFRQTPVLARFGGPDGLSAQPWFGRDALRTAASWAGMADRAFDAATVELAGRPGRGKLEALAVGRMLTAQQTISAWLDVAARAMDGGARAPIDDAAPARDDPAPAPPAIAAPALPAVALHARAAVADASRQLLDEAARACGSHPFATGGDLDRARRDLELFVLQHRLEPGLAAAGERLLSVHARDGR